MGRLARLVAIGVLALLVGGCANQTSEGGTVEEQQATLAARPTIDEITARYERMQAELRQRLVAEVGIAGWIKDSELSGSGCGSFPDVPTAESRRLPAWYSPGNLPDARWSQALAIITEVTGNYGFAPPEIIVDRPNEHNVVGVDQYGASYDFGTGKNTVLGVSTGCHLNPPDSPPP